ncbi:MAG: hypothetical protein ACFFBD_27225, partial [Candidatus Hodarchaeota archaeon]
MVDISFLLYNTVWMVPFIFPFILILFISLFKLPKRGVGTVVILSFVVYFLLIIVNNFLAVFILLAYGGEFAPSTDLIVGILAYCVITEIIICVVMLLLILIIKRLKPLSKTVFTNLTVSITFDENNIDDTLDFFDTPDGHWTLALIFSWISLFFLFVSKPTNIAYVQRYLAFWLDALTLLIVLLFIGASIWTSLVLGRLLLSKLTSQQEDHEFVRNYTFYLTGAFLGLGIITFFIHEFFGLGISIISGKELYFPIAFLIVVSVILGVIL